MNTPCPTHPALECWRWLAFKIGCGLEPESPELLDRHRQAGEHLLCLGLIDERELAEQALDLLYRSACDVLLPWHWRCLCMDMLCQPLQALNRLSGQDPHLQARLRLLRLRLASTEVLPSEPPSP